MENIDPKDPQQIRIQGLLDRYLVSNFSGGRISTEAHIDDDSLSAFVEGGLAEREAGPIVRHLADCSFCRHVTAELVRLDVAMSGEEEAVTIEPAVKSPTRISDILGGITARIFGGGDSAVFAHGEDDNKADDADTKDPETPEKD